MGTFSIELFLYLTLAWRWIWLLLKIGLFKYWMIKGLHQWLTKNGKKEFKKWQQDSESYNTRARDITNEDFSTNRNLEADIETHQFYELLKKHWNCCFGFLDKLAKLDISKKKLYKQSEKKKTSYKFRHSKGKCFN